MKEVICTIITGNYAHYALALHDSVLKFNTEVDFAVFVSKDSIPDHLISAFKGRGILLYTIENVVEHDLANQLKDKYLESYHDAYRWGMKPVFMSVLLENYNRVIYVDSDIYFFNDFSFLFDKLKACNILLSPHWRSSNPNLDKHNFKLNFLDGIYNGGFIGASRGGFEALQYWASLCLYNCEVNRSEGFYVDQRYLDLLPTRFEGVDHIRHKGCNIANWNLVDCKRTLNETGEVLINGKYPIVFIHITNSFFRGVFFEGDELLKPYLEAYRDAILKYQDVDVIEKFLKVGIHLKPRGDKLDNTNSKSFLRTILKRLHKYFK